MSDLRPKAFSGAKSETQFLSPKGTWQQSPGQANPLAGERSPGFRAKVPADSEPCRGETMVGRVSTASSRAVVLPLWGFGKESAGDTVTQGCASLSEDLPWALLPRPLGAMSSAGGFGIASVEA